MSNANDLRLAGREVIKLGRHSLGSNWLRFVAVLLLQDIIGVVSNHGGTLDSSLEAVIEEGIDLEVNSSSSLDSTSRRVDLHVELSDVTLYLIKLDDELVVLDSDPIGLGLAINSHGVDGTSSTSSGEGIEAEIDSLRGLLNVVSDVLNALTGLVLIIADKLAVNNELSISGGCGSS